MDGATAACYGREVRCRVLRVQGYPFIGFAWRCVPETMVAVVLDSTALKAKSLSIIPALILKAVRQTGVGIEARHLVYLIFFFFRNPEEIQSQWRLILLLLAKKNGKEDRKGAISPTNQQRGRRSCSVFRGIWS